MAEIFPDEGLDWIMNQWLHNVAAPEDMELRLFSSQSATTVITSAQGTADITECAWTNYASQTLGSATWGAQAAGSGGRKSTYPQVTFPTCGATGGTANGFYITNSVGGTCVCAANFDDTTAVVLQSGDIIKVTPTVQHNN